MTYAQLKKAVEKKGYRFFDTGAYNINMIAVRNVNAKTDSFDCKVYWAFRDDKDKEVVLEATATTLPGKDWMEHPVSQDAARGGCAAIAPGQYRGAYALGNHGTGSWRHPAFVQVGPIKVYRDNNWDDVYDFDPTTITSGLYGCNVHRSVLGGSAKKVGKFSAGCIVTQNDNEAVPAIEAAKKAVRIWGNSFTLTLLLSTDLK